ncbi:hypothetical protein CDD83_5379 [Cordyceps sp. RAO-2017]|nr:hypothetical protein CDD83_5379 [Cordyceps sp. RAO-2017]
MSLCPAQDHSDMLGLGIRVASYVQWLAALCFQHIGPESLPEIRLLGLLLSGGITIGLLVQVAYGRLDAAAIYISLLLATGSHMFLVPVYVWRAVMCWDPFWNPLTWYGEEELRTYKVLKFAQIVTASSVGVWFFTTYLPGLDRDCLQYGFLFSKTQLDHNAAFAAFNAILYLAICIVCTVTAASKVCCRIKSRPPKRRLGSKRTREHIKCMHAPHTLSDLLVFAMLVAAAELSVQWNELSTAVQLDTSAQLIPLLVSIGIVVRVTYLHVAEEGDDSNAGKSRTVQAASGNAPRSVQWWDAEGNPWAPRRPPPTHGAGGTNQVR